MNAARAQRRTVVVHTKLAGHMARVAAARAGENGVQIMTMGQLAARLASGLLRPVNPDALREALREALPTVPMGELSQSRIIQRSKSHASDKQVRTK